MKIYHPSIYFFANKHGQPPKTYPSHMPLLGKPPKAADFPAKSAQLMGFSVVPHDESDIYGKTKIKTEAEKTHPSGGVFFMEDIKDAPLIKSQIQSGESGLDVKRVHIYVVFYVTACLADDGFNSSISAANQLKLVLESSFSAVIMSLVMVVNETNNTYEALPLLRGFSTNPHFNHHFIFCEKNELNIINAESRQKISMIIARLPLLFSMQSNFFEIMTTKSREKNRPLFISAGIWQKEAKNGQAKTFEINAAKTLKSLASILEKEMSAKPASTPAIYSEPEKPANPMPDINTDLESTIAASVTSVAAKPLKIHKIWGHNLKEAENLLYGTAAEDFFKKYFDAAQSQPPKTCNPKQHESQAVSFSPLPSMRLSQATAMEARLCDSLFETEAQILTLSAEFNERQNKKVPFLMGLKVFSKTPIDQIKDEIGKSYALFYRINQLKAYHTNAAVQLNQLEDYLNYIRGLIEEIKARPEPDAEDTNNNSQQESLSSKEALNHLKALTPQEATTLAPFQVSLLRDDDLLRESFTIENEPDFPILLRLIGGFTPENLIL